MTIIAAMRCLDCLLIGADGQATDTCGVRIVTRKLSIASDQPGRRVAWGFCGDEGIGKAFERWLEKYQWPEHPTWKALTADAGDELSRLSGERRRRADLAKEKLGENDSTDVLLAGYISDEAMIWQLSSSGDVAEVDDNLRIIGSGSAFGYVAHRTLTVVNQPEFCPEALNVILEVAVQMADLCGPPKRILKLGPGEISVLTPR